MNVLIVGRTKMSGTSRCIGGLAEDGRSVRLINPTGQWDTSAPFHIGQIWDIEFKGAPALSDPHTEDLIVGNYSYVADEPNLIDRIKSLTSPHTGDISSLFNGYIRFTGSNNGFINHANGVPKFSTCFWISDEDVTLRSDGKHYECRHWFSLKGMSYKGEPTPTQTISAGTLMRVSLARWWKPEDVDIEERCYVQLSGWF